MKTMMAVLMALMVAMLIPVTAANAVTMPLDNKLVDGEQGTWTITVPAYDAGEVIEVKVNQGPMHVLDSSFNTVSVSDGNGGYAAIFTINVDVDTLWTITTIGPGPMQNVVTQAKYDEWDTSDDGSISVSEFAAIHYLEHFDAPAMFAELDTDDDDALSLAELNELVDPTCVHLRMLRLQITTPDE